MGPLETNTYLLLKDGEALIVDPSFTSEKEFELIQKDLQDYDLKGILLTHGHIDHIVGIPLILAWKQVDVYINPNEAHFLKDPSLNLSNMIPPHFVYEGTCIDLNSGHNSIASFDFEVLNTPGHTAGSQSFVFGTDVVCGDFIFAGSVGRMDFPTGSEDDMMNSIREFVALYKNQEVTLYPGHGYSTSLAGEMLRNMYIHHALN